MKLEIQKPESCFDCVFGEERGYDCSLLNGELCYDMDCKRDRPEWCPFDNDGKTITAEGVVVIV
jgi:hypothetical protein